MPRVRRNVAENNIETNESDVVIAGPALVATDEDLSDVEKLRIALGDYAGAGMVKVYRVDTKTQKLTYLQTIEPADFLNAGEELLRDQYGTGTYEARVYENGQVVTRGRVAVEAPRWVAPAGTSDRHPQTTINVPPSGGADMVAAMAAAMRDGFAQIAAMIPKPVSMTEQLSQLRVLADIVRPAQQAQSGTSLQDFIGLFSLAKQMVSDSSGERSDLDALVSLGRPLVERMVQATPVAAPAPAVAPVPDDGAAMVRGFLDTLVAQAQAGADVAPLADLIVQQVPPAALDEILDPPDWFERLSQIHPGVGGHQAWFGRLYAALTSDPESADNPPA